MVDGTELKSYKKIDLPLEIQGDKDTIYNISPYIIKNMSTDLILGIDFLTSNDSTINCRNMTLTLDDKVYEFENITKPADPDFKIASKTRILQSTIINKYEKVNKIIDEFKRTMPELGCISGCEHVIRLNEEKIVNKRPYRIPIGIKEQVQTEIKKLISSNIIRRSQSPYSSPAFPIKKRNGKIRLVIDYRELNRITIPINHPFPSITECLATLGNSKIFSQIDLNSGYYQIPMDESSIKYTAFSLDNNHYEFLRMPFGLTNALMTFQKYMMEIFEDIKFVKIYLDDLLIHTKNENEHLDHLKTVLEILRKQNISINFEKSKFQVEEVSYLGHTITSNGIKPSLERIERIKDIIEK
ncbi:Retrovirus-related Pol polyprotein from transposon 17.6 [Dictyocoela muelleri]|nr:Retrovirus-related Pol polyprotein from transposon 17.6 [Dictyocoela muelleri]